MPCCEIHPRVMSPEEAERELEGDGTDLQWLPPGEVARRSRVAAFYDGAAVFLTGATGFIGSLVLEKLLRACPGLATVYVLVRDKKGVPLRERLQSHLEKEIFAKARRACPDYLRKVVPVAGDCTQPGLGLSAADAAELCARVSVVFHVAATVRFDADLRTAAVTNVGATCEVVALCKRMPNLKAFVYMSTAYSNAPTRLIEEKFYSPPLKAEELMKLICVMNDEQLAQVLPLLLGDWPNTYTFTKSIAEDVLREAATELPISVIRPSIVSCTYREPLALWAGNMYGPSAIAAGGGVGLMHVLPLNVNALADSVPADMVANATVVCAWDTWRRHSTLTSIQHTPTEPVVYNCVSSPRHPITWGYIYRYAKLNFYYPSIRNMWHACGIQCNNKYLYVTAAVLLHLVPAILADTCLRIMGKKPLLWNLYARIHGTLQALEPFMTQEWRFTDDNLASMLDSLGAVDRQLFPFDIVDLDWVWHVSSTWRGVRLYLLNESYDNLEQARRRYRRLEICHYILVIAGSALLLYMLWWIVSTVIGL